MRNVTLYGMLSKHLICLSFLLVPFSAFSATHIHFERALSAFEQDRYDESMIHLKNALKASPENLPSKILMGKLLTKIGRPALAKVEFEEALSQGADVSSFSSYLAATLFKLKAYEQLIEFDEFSNLSNNQKIDWLRIKSSACLKIKNYRCAKESFITIGELTEDSTEKLNGLAQVGLAERQYDLANNYLDQALDINPSLAISWQLKGLIAKAQKNIPDAIEYMQQAFKLSPDDPLILRHLADVYLASDHKEKAKSTINTILVTTPDDPFAILVNSWLQQDTELEAEAEARFKIMAAKIANLPNEYVEKEEALLFLRALVSFRQQNFDKAARDFTLLRKLDESDLTPVILLAKSYIALGKEKDAIALLESNQQLLNVLPDTMAMLGDLYINSGRNFKAVTLLEDLSTQHPDNLQVSLLQAKLFIARGKIEEGLSLVEGLLAKHPDDTTILFVHCILSLQSKAFFKANESIDKLLAIQPDDPLKLNIKGAIMIHLGEIEQAQIFILKALDILPNLLSAKMNLASTHFFKDEISQSEALLNEIIADDAKHLPALLLLAKIQDRKQEFSAALKNYRTILFQDRQHIEALEGLVSIYVQQNELTIAINQLNKLRTIVPNHPKYVIDKAQIYLRLKDTDNAAKEIQILENLSQNNAPLLIATHKLQVLNNDLDGAIRSISRAQMLQPQSLSIGVQFAELLLDNRKTELAASQINTLISRFSEEEDVIYLQARLAEQQGQLTKANQLYSRVLALNTSYDLALGKMYSLLAYGVSHQLFVTKVTQIVEANPERFFPRNLLAQYYYYQDDYSNAAKQYEILLTYPSLPNKAAMLGRLASVYMPSDISKSQKYAEQAYALDDTNPVILSTLGWVLTQQGQPARGLDLLRKAIARGNKNLSLHYYVAVSLAKLSLTREAKLELEKLFEQATLIPEHEQALALFNTL